MFHPSRDIKGKESEVPYRRWCVLGALIKTAALATLRNKKKESKEWLAVDIFLALAGASYWHGAGV